jgi:hypothetical protein
VIKAQATVRIHPARVQAAVVMYWLTILGLFDKVILGLRITVALSEFIEEKPVLPQRVLELYLLIIKQLLVLGTRLRQMQLPLGVVMFLQADK